MIFKILPSRGKNGNIGSLQTINLSAAKWLTESAALLAHKHWSSKDITLKAPSSGTHKNTISLRLDSVNTVQCRTSQGAKWIYVSLQTLMFTLLLFDASRWFAVAAATGKQHVNEGRGPDTRRTLLRSRPGGLEINLQQQQQHNPGWIENLNQGLNAWARGLLMRINWRLEPMTLMGNFTSEEKHQKLQVDSVHLLQNRACH